jgi:iron complex outermembrane receptor protein
MLNPSRFIRSIFSVLALPIALAAAFSVTSTTAIAQEEEDEEYLDEIIVTSRFREERLQQTPIAITALSGDELEIRAFNTAYEVGYTVPNAALRPAQAAFGNTMTAYIRGVGQYDFNFAFEPGVGIYIDEVYHPFVMGSQIDLLDLDRVEVLRGPQGTLFGRGAIGGVIRYVTERAQGDNTGNISVTYGEFDRIDVRGSYDFSLVEDRLYARVAGVSKSRDGYQHVIDFACAFPSEAGNLQPLTSNRGKDCKVGTQGGQDITGARATFRLVASDALEFNLTFDYLDDASEARADTLTLVADSTLDDDYKQYVLNDMLGVAYDDRWLPPNIYTTYATYSDPLSTLAFEPQTALEKQAISGVIDWDVTDTINARLILAQTDITSKFSTDADASPLNMQTVDGFQDIETTTAELRVSGRAMDRLDWTVGAFYYDGSSDDTQAVSIPWLTMFLDMFLPNAFGNCYLPGVPFCTWTPEEAAQALITDWEHYTFVKSNNLHELGSESVFAHFVFDITENLSLNIGGRYSDDEKIVQFDNTRVIRPNLVVENTSTDWRVGLDFQLSDDILLYGSVATGYRPASYNPRPFQVTQVVSVDAEDATSYDIGMKSDLFNNTLRLNIALFYNDWENRILPFGGVECVLLDPGPPPVYDTVAPNTPGATEDINGNWCFGTVPATSYNNAPATIQGAELEFMWRPTEALTLSGQVGMLDWESPDVDNCDGNNDGVPDPGVTCINDLPPLVPDLNWSFGINYDIPLGNGGTLSPRADVYAQNETCFGVTSRNGCVDPYELVNVALMWTSPDADWNITLGATNVTDEEYFLNAFDLVGFGQQTVEKQPGPPSEWYVTFRRTFE